MADKLGKQLCKQLDIGQLLTNENKFKEKADRLTKLHFDIITSYHDYDYKKKNTSRIFDQNTNQDQEDYGPKTINEHIIFLISFLRHCLKVNNNNTNKFSLKMQWTIATNMCNIIKAILYPIGHVTLSMIEIGNEIQNIINAYMSNFDVPKPYIYVKPCKQINENRNLQKPLPVDYTCYRAVAVKETSSGVPRLIFFNTVSWADDYQNINDFTSNNNNTYINPPAHGYQIHNNSNTPRTNQLQGNPNPRLLPQANTNQLQGNHNTKSNPRLNGNKQQS